MKDTYTIKDVAERMGVSVDTLRYYEKIGLIHAVERLSNSHRRYSLEDIYWVEFLLKLRATGMSIQQMTAFVKLQRQGEATLAQRIEMLRMHKQQLEDQLQQTNGYLSLIDGKINYYEGVLHQQQGAEPSHQEI